MGSWWILSRPAGLLVSRSQRQQHHRFKVTRTECEQPCVPQRSYGQPVPSTHPHILKLGELFPGMTTTEFQHRRQRLMEGIKRQASRSSEKTSGHIVVIPAATKSYMSEKIPYIFRQNSDFLYLSGCLEPDCALVLASIPGKSLPDHMSTLFMPKRDSQSELWDGPSTHPDDVPSLFGLDQGLPLGQLGPFLAQTSQSYSSSPFTLWYDLTSSGVNIHRYIRDFLSSPSQKLLESPRSLVHRLRLIKSPAEINLMRHTCRIASEAISETMRFSKPGVDEHCIFAKVDYECRVRGAQQLAYPPVVAGGSRSNVIHYVNNNQTVADGEMVLMDAGCEYHGYCSDITRTWPVSGHFSPAQRDLYEAVLDVQKTLIGLCTKRPTLDELFGVMCTLLGDRLKSVGVIPDNFSKDELSKAAYSFCPHHVSHYLGMDVHDSSLMNRSMRLEPGMVVTVEPGLYINQHRKDVPSHFRGLGIRIEDDVLITEDGVEVLSAKCPKKVVDIETLLEDGNPQL